jgi:hypothetical protein
MLTTILLSSLLFLAGSAPAQDSPIRVGDSSTKTPPGTPGTSLQHKHFIPNGDNYYVEEKGYTSGCFEVVGGPPRPPQPLGKVWTLVLSNNVVLNTADGARIDIVYSGQPVQTGTAPNGDEVHQLVGNKLTSGDLSINHGKVSKYPVSATAFQKPLRLVIHYCKIIKDGSLDCRDANDKDTCK